MWIPVFWEAYTSVNSSEYNSSHYLCSRLANILFIDY